MVYRPKHRPRKTFDTEERDGDDLDGQQRRARPKGTSSWRKYEEAHLPYGAKREGKESNAAYKASAEHKDGSAVYELEPYVAASSKSTVVGRLYVTAFDYPEHIGAPTTQTNISRAFAYSRLLSGAPTEATPLHIKTVDNRRSRSSVI